MKIFSLTLNFILLIAVSILFYFHFSENKISNSGSAEQTIKSDSLSILVNDTILKATAYINTDTLFENFLFVKEMRDDLAAEKLKSENDYNVELKKLEKEVYEFQEKAPNMSQQEGEAKQLELSEKEQKLMKFERDLTAKLSDLEGEKNQKIQKLVSEYLGKLNKEKNYAYIFGYNGMGNVLLANPQLDITNSVVDGMNTEYKKKASDGVSSRNKN